MKMDQYLAHKDYALWEVILNEGLDKRYDIFQRLLSLLEIYGAEHISSTNELNDAYTVYTTTCHSSQAQGSSSYADELMFSFFANQSSSPQLDNKDLEQIDQDDLEEMDLKWQVAMLSIRVKQFYKKTKRKLEFNGKEPVGFDKTKVECFNYHRTWHFARDCKTTKNSGNMSRDAGNAGDRGRDNEDKATDFALMAFTSNPSSSSSSNFEHERLRKANLEIIGYQYGLESIEGQLHVHQQNEVIYEEKIRVLEYNVKDKSYDSPFNEKEVLDVKEEEMTETVFDNRSIDEENSLANDRFMKGEGYHAVPPPLTENYMPPKSDLLFAGLDDSVYKFKISEIVTSLTKDEKDALETSTAFVEKTKEVRTNAPLIQDWNPDSDNDSVFRPTHNPAKIDIIKAGESVKPICWDFTLRDDIDGITICIIVSYTRVRLGN
nr:ribonuclease H-like domain-containing protein [Tanacetum cinerariifolium]